MKHKSCIILYLVFSFLAIGCKKEEKLSSNELAVSGNNGKYIITPTNGDWMIEISSNDNLLSINSIKPGASSCTMVVRELQEKTSITFLVKDDKKNKKVVIEDGEITQSPTDEMNPRANQ